MPMQIRNRIGWIIPQVTVYTSWKIIFLKIYLIFVHSNYFGQYGILAFPDKKLWFSLHLGEKDTDPDWQALDTDPNPLK